MSGPSAAGACRALPPMPAADPLGALLEPFDPVDAALAERRSLLQRADTKFLLDVRALGLALGPLASAYAVLLAGGERVARYETLYYDVPSLRGFDDHARGRAPRHKVRARHYPDRALCFLEVKSRTNRGTTGKARRPHPFGEPSLSAEEQAWALGITGWTGPLSAQAWTGCRRITLLGLEADERVTVDLDLRVERPPCARRLDGLAIVEVKQARPDPRSPAVQALRRAGARAGSVSKYAVAMGLLAAGVRRNRLLPTLREIGRYGTWQSSSARIGSSTAATSSSSCPGSPWT